jgi:hypothetical protein
MSANNYNELITFCINANQRDIISALIAFNGNRSQAGDMLGMTTKQIRQVIHRVKGYKKNAIVRNESIGLHQPEGESFKPIKGHFIKGESAMVDEHGAVKQKWIKTDTDFSLKIEFAKNAIVEAIKGYKGKSHLVDEPEKTNDDILCLIPIGDAHISMMSWAPESGENFDLKIAERELCCAIERLVESSPNATTCIIADMGDFLHRNSNKNSTPESGNILDCDSRFSKMMRVAVKVLIHAVHTALGKFRYVVLRNVVGNHAPEAEQMLSIAMELYFHNNARVKVESGENKFWYYQHGKTLLGFCHGDKVKHNELPMIMASDVPKMWGLAEFRYFFIGHIHHQSVKEYQGCSVESINTLTPNDAWHHGSGYRARKNIKLIVFDKNYGEIERITKDVSMIRDSMGEGHIEKQ